MTVRDLLLVLGAVPLLGVIALRLAAETGLAKSPPPPDALTASLALFGLVFVLYVALTLRAIARATREILERDATGAVAPETAPQSRAAVSDFAIHLDRSGEIDLRAEESEPLADDEPAPPAPGAAARTELFGEVKDLLTRIPSARSR